MICGMNNHVVRTCLTTYNNHPALSNRSVHSETLDNWILNTKSDKDCRAVPKGRMFLIGVRSFSDKFQFYFRNHSHKQSSLLDTMFEYMFYFGAPGKSL